MITKLKICSWFFEIVAALFVLLFLYTAISKLQLIDIFIYTVQFHPLLKPYAHVVGWTIPIIELLICLVLFIPATRRKGVILATCLMAVFTAYVAYMLTTFSHLPCSCGGIVETMDWESHLLFNSLCTVLGISAILFQPKSLLTTNRRSRTPVETSRQSLIN